MLQIIFSGMSSEATARFPTMFKPGTFNKLLALITTINMGINNNRAYATKNYQLFIVSEEQTAISQGSSTYPPPLMSAPSNHPQNKIVPNYENNHHQFHVSHRYQNHPPTHYQLKRSTHKIVQRHPKSPTTHIIEQAAHGQRVELRKLTVPITKMVELRVGVGLLTISGPIDTRSFFSFISQKFYYTFQQFH